MNTTIVSQNGDDLTVSTDALAEGMQLEHRQVIRAVRDNMEDLERFGRVDFENQPFETRGGTQVREVAHLTEHQATFLLTSFRNIGLVKEFKVKLVQEFYRMRQALTAPKSLEQRSLEILGELSAKVKEQGEQIAELAPKADAWDGLASGNGTYAVGDAAKMLCQVGIETGRDRLFEFMQGISWVYRRSGRWQAMQHAVNAGRLMHKPQSHPHPETGEIVLDAPQVRVTMKGLNELRALMLPPIPRLQLVGEVA